MTARLIEFPARRGVVIGDPDLAERASGGDRDAFGELVRRHQATVRGMLRRLTGGHSADADDLSQSAFLRAWAQIGTYSGGLFRSWVCTIAYREFLQARRKTASQTRVKEAVQVLFAGRIDTSQHGVTRDMDRALAALPEAQRIAIVLCVSAGLSHGEAALATGWPLGTVKSNVQRGKAALRVALIDYDQGYKEDA